MINGHVYVECFTLCDLRFIKRLYLVVCFMWFQDTFRFLVEDENMDLILDEEKHMFSLIEETYGVAEVNTNKELVRTNRGGGWRRVQCFMNESEVQCYDILRMNQSTFNSLCKILSEKYQLVESGHVYLKESVAMFLEMVGQDLTVRALAERYQHSSDTVKRKLDEVLSSLLKHAADIVKPGRDEFASVSPILVDDPQYYPFF